MAVAASNDRRSATFESWLVQRPVQFALLLLLIATLLASLYMTQDYRQLVAADVPGRSLGKIARQRYVIWYLWALMTPAIIIVGSRFRSGNASGVARVGTWVVLGLAFGAAHSAVFATLTELSPWLAITKPAASIPFAIWQRVEQSYAANLLLFGAIALAYHVAAYAYDVRAREREATQLEARLARSELELLKMQLQPHFMFNTLQTASALIEYDVAAARRVLATLGSLLRFSLDNLGTNEVALKDEVAILRQYLDIQSARFRNRLDVTIDIDPTVENVLVPGLLLQPLVENAIRHGVEPRARGGSIGVSAARESGVLRISIVDDGPGIHADSVHTTNGNGVGLANVRARLYHLYGDNARVTLANRAEGGCCLTVEMPARDGPPRMERIDG